MLKYGLIALGVYLVYTGKWKDARDWAADLLHDCLPGRPSRQVAAGSADPAPLSGNTVGYGSTAVPGSSKSRGIVFGDIAGSLAWRGTATGDAIAGGAKSPLYGGRSGITGGATQTGAPNVVVGCKPRCGAC